MSFFHCIRTGSLSLFEAVFALILNQVCAYGRVLSPVNQDLDMPSLFVIVVGQ